MNKQKILVIVLAAIVVVFGAVHLLQGRTPTAAKSPASPTATPMIVAQTPQTPSLLDTISSDVILIGQIVPANFRPLREWLETRYATLSALTLWKKFAVEKNIIEQFESNFEKNNNLGGPEQSSKNLADFYSMIEKAKAFIGDLNDGILVISPQSFAVEEGLDLPKVLIELTFKDTNTSTNLREAINKTALGGKSELQGEALSIKREGDSYLIHIRPDPSLDIPAKLILTDHSLSAIIGAEDDLPFRVKAGETPLIKSERWRKVSSSWTTASASIVYFEPSRLTGVAEKVLSKASPEARQEISNTILKGLEGADAVFYNSDFEGGLHATQCALSHPGSEYARVTTSFLKARAKVPPSTQFERMINSNTIVGFRVLLTGLQDGFDYALRVFPSLSKQTGSGNVLRIFKTINAYLEATGLKEAGIVINASPGMPMPEAGLLLADGSLKGDALLTKTAELIPALLSDPAVASNNSTAVSHTSGVKGRALLSMPGGPSGMPIIGAVVNESSLVFGLNEMFIDQSEKALASGLSGFSMFAPLRGNLLNDTAGWDYYLYLNTEKAFSMLRGYLPMLLAMSARDGKPPLADINEVNQVIDFLSSALISLQRTSMTSDDVVCSEKFLTTLTPKKLEK